MQLLANSRSGSHHAGPGRGSAKIVRIIIRAGGGRGMLALAEKVDNTQDATHESKQPHGSGEHDDFAEAGSLKRP